MENPQKLSIKNWAEADRPREKMLMRGSSALTDSELLAILIGSGSRTESAVELAQRILRQAEDSLHLLGKMSVQEMTKIKGVGPAKAVTISAALELGRRRKNTEVEDRPKITCSRDAYNVLTPLFIDLPHEEMWALLLDRANKVEHKMQVSKGGISGTVVDVRLILREAINRYTSGIILAHNHPSGNCVPSNQDIQITKKLKEGCKLMDINLLDHLIVCDKKYYSFGDEGII